ncbi:MAG: hypothetical protein ACRESZ_10240 [Methylococcales bacterium]
MRYSENDESTSQNQYSPGSVNDSEELLRVLFYPEHVVNGCVLETAIALEDLGDRGFSVDRRSYASRSVIEGRINRQMENPNMRDKRQETTVAKFSCSEVRLLVDNGNKACIVIDTASLENRAHASIYSLKDLKKGGLRKIRSLLLPLLQERFSIHEIFSES